MERVSVVIPALNEAERIASVVAIARKSLLVDEILVIDDGSVDETPELARALGAAVVTSTLLGKGASMQDGMRVAHNDLILYLDGDLAGLAEDLVERMCRPLLEGRADFVKAAFTRAAGRVTALTAKPLLAIFFPELNAIEQPLGGILAARQSLLRRLRFESDYGVDIGLLLDASAEGARIEQADIGHIDNDSQSLDTLGEMAKQVVRVILDRAARRKRLNPAFVTEVEEVKRRSQAELSVVLKGLEETTTRLALLDMDGVLLDGRFIVALAQETGREGPLSALLDNPAMAPEERTHRIAAIFAGVPKEVIEQMALRIPLMPGAQDVVVALRKAGYRVGIVTDSFRSASEIVRRRVFADFSVAHLLRFRAGKATGEVTLSPAMSHSEGCRQHAVCKVNVMHHVLERMGLTAEQVLAVGDGENDICLLKTAGTSVAFRPRSPEVERAAQRVVWGALTEVISESAIASV
ncbi:MAG: glycosyltransferase [Planctomycetota bacterium]